MALTILPLSSWEMIFVAVSRRAVRFFETSSYCDVMVSAFLIYISLGIRTAPAGRKDLTTASRTRCHALRPAIRPPRTRRERTLRTHFTLLLSQLYTLRQSHSMVRVWHRSWTPVWKGSEPPPTAILSTRPCERPFCPGFRNSGNRRRLASVNTGACEAC